jgi:WD40 repeat protein/DNA-binding CsgD family transcriptional regulator
VGEWEAGLSYPSASHLKHFIELGVQQQVFAAGREAQEIRALWQATHQKVLLDESWLEGLLGTPHPRLALVPPGPVEQISNIEPARAPPAMGPRVVWGEALAVPTFYGRQGELATLEQWVVQAHCRVVSVLGLGGIGKSALAVTVMHQVAAHFQVVVFRSLRDAPACSALLEDCLQGLAPEPLADVPASLDGRLSLLLEYVREARTLLVLDNLETLLVEGEGTGRLRAGYEGYGRLLRRMAETEHQSCLLLTSREKPRELVPLEGGRTPVRALRLSGLDAEAGAQLLEERGVLGTVSERGRLVERYGGNPLALKIVAQTIVELFGGEIAAFLEQGEVVFGSVREQFDRLSALEQTVLLWLAILREPVSIEELLAVLAMPLARAQALEAVEALRRRSLIERGKQPGSFTLQSVVLEYATERLITEVASDIEQGTFARVIEQGLELATSKEYVRQTQQRLIVAPLLGRLRGRYRRREEVEERLLALLDQFRARATYAQGYGPANVLALLRQHWGHLRGLDLSQLTIRGASLQGVEMQDATLSGATLQDTVFTEAFAAIWAVAISRDGQYWAAGGRRGEVQVWRQGGKILHLAWQAHTDRVSALAFSPDGRTLATGSWDGAIKLWDLESGSLLWTSRQTNTIQCVAFAPYGRTLASGGDDTVIWLWDARGGTFLQRLNEPSAMVNALAWSRDGSLLASGGFDGNIRLWEMQGAKPGGANVQILAGHTNLVAGLAFAPDGRTLASGSWDRTVKLWDVESLDVRQTLTGHSDLVCAVAWSPDGRFLASCSSDQTIRLWDREPGTSHRVFHGHASVVYSIAFTPDSRGLLSGTEDGTLRLWEVESGQCVHILQGYANTLYDVAWSPDGTQVVSGGTDTFIDVWSVDGGTHRVLRGHRWIVYGVAWSPDGELLASSGWDNAIWLWDASTGASVQLLRDPNLVDTITYFGIAWSPDGQWLATASFPQGVQVWEVTTRTLRWTGNVQPTRIYQVAWSPDSTRLAGSGDHGSLFLWGTSDGARLAQFQGHRGMVASVAWSPDGTRLASGGGSRGKGELFVWDTRSGERLYTLNEPSEIVFALVWSPTSAALVSGSDGLLRWWDLRHGECVRVRKAHQGAVQSLKCSPDGRRLASCGDDGALMLWDLESGERLRTLRRDRPYERMEISGVQGLTEAQRASLRALGAVEERAVPLTAEQPIVASPTQKRTSHPPGPAQGSPGHPSVGHPFLDPLSQRELEVLQLVAAGASNQEIAQALVLAPGTVKLHVSHLLSKLGVTSRTRAMLRVRDLGLLPDK